MSHEDNGNTAMKVDVALIRELAEMLGETGLSEIEVEDGDRGEKNRIQKAITPDHKDYAAIMGSGGGNTGGGFAPHAASAPATSNAPRPAATSNRPSWAQ